MVSMTPKQPLTNEQIREVIGALIRHVFKTPENLRKLQNEVMNQKFAPDVDLLLSEQQFKDLLQDYEDSK